MAEIDHFKNWMVKDDVTLDDFARRLADDDEGRRSLIRWLNTLEEPGKSYIVGLLELTQYWQTVKLREAASNGREQRD